jgi:hypothetical protein
MVCWVSQVVVFDNVAVDNIVHNNYSTVPNYFDHMFLVEAVGVQHKMLFDLCDMWMAVQNVDLLQVDSIVVGGLVAGNNSRN